VALGVGDGVVVPPMNDPLGVADGATDGAWPGAGGRVATTGPLDWLGTGENVGDGLDRGVVVCLGVGRGVGVGDAAVTVTWPFA